MEGILELIINYKYRFIGVKIYERKKFQHYFSRYDSYSRNNCGGGTFIIDPLFHYHAPLNNLAYPINDERYQNDGIIKHFDYNAIITGSSMTENFKTSESDKLFNVNTVKLSYSGATFKEINDNLKIAFSYNENIKMIIRSFDDIMLVHSKDAMPNDLREKKFDYPTYLTDNNIFNDVKYLLNKDILFKRTIPVLEYTIHGEKTTNFDEAYNWNDQAEYGKEEVLKSYQITTKASKEKIYTENDNTMILENVVQNVTELADKHQECTFYLFFPPYSICRWDMLYMDGWVNYIIDAEKAAIEEILKHSNINLYSFNTKYDMITNLDNYMDDKHYGDWINSHMLEWMASEEGLLTYDNYEDYIDNIRAFYNSYNYSRLHDE